MVSIQNLHKKYGKNQVLSGVDLTINSGGIFAVLGPNGSGKTTLIKSILGMVIPNQGVIEVLNKNIKKNSDYRHQIEPLKYILPSNKNTISSETSSTKLMICEVIKMVLPFAFSV